MVKRSKGKMILLTAVAATLLLIYRHAPTVAGEWTKQTCFLWFLNNWHIQAEDAKPRIVLIDDDSGDGVYIIRQLCDEFHIKATFAIIPALMNKRVCDSLRNWQKEGFGIALHSYSHNDWRMWKYEDVHSDLVKCEEWLSENGFEHDIKYVVPPHGSNTKTVRKAIKDKGYKMVTGANILNPDKEVFQYGRVFITQDTDLREMEDLLKRARNRKEYIILGTHSSMPGEFSREKTKAVLQKAKELEFEFQ